MSLNFVVDISAETRDLLRTRIRSFEFAVKEASDGKNLKLVHDSAAAISETLHVAVAGGGKQLQKAADALDHVLAKALTSRSMYVYNAVSVIITAIKVGIAAGEIPIHDGVNDVEQAVHSAVNVVDVFLHAVVEGSSVTDAVGKAGEASMTALGDATKAVETVGLTPFRLAAKVVTAAIATFVTCDEKSHVLTIARAALAAIEAASDTDTPFTAATNAFKGYMDQQAAGGAPADEEMLKLVNNVAEMVDSLQGSAPSSSLLYDFMIQSLVWTWELNRLVKQYPQDGALGLAAEKVGAAVLKMQELIDAKYKD